MLVPEEREREREIRRGRVEEIAGKGGENKVREEGEKEIWREKHYYAGERVDASVQRGKRWLIKGREGMKRER